MKFKIEDNIIDDRCYISPGKKGIQNVILAVPKCLSTAFDNGKWKKTKYRTWDEYPNFINKKFIVVIRNPVERWVSGAYEYLSRNLEMSFRDWNPYQIIFDPHTIPQIDHWINIPVNLIEWYIMEDFSMEAFNRKYKIWDQPLDVIHTNRYTGKTQKKIKLRNFVQDRFSNDIKLQKKVQKTYANDIKIYNSIRREILQTGIRNFPYYPCEVKWKPNPLLFYGNKPLPNFVKDFE